ncbi:hypothetical protein [Kaarinaea lacus]
MEIEGPLSISVQDDETSMKRELHLSFKPDFIQEKLFERTEAFQKYVDLLNHNLQKLEKDNSDRLGMETILQICENLSEYITRDEINLNKTIVIEINSAIDITNLITGPGSIN